MKSINLENFICMCYSIIQWDDDDLILFVSYREEDMTGIGELIESFMAESSQCLTYNKDSENNSVCALVVHCLEVSLRRR